MLEYRIQVKRNGDWKFVRNSHGGCYTYTSIDSVKKYAPYHVRRVWNSETRQWDIVPESYRIVAAEIDWQPVDLSL